MKLLLMQNRRYLDSLYLYSDAKYTSDKYFDLFHLLKRCEVTDAAVLVIVDHLKIWPLTCKKIFLI